MEQKNTLIETFPQNINNRENKKPFCKTANYFNYNNGNRNLDSKCS